MGKITQLLHVKAMRPWAVAGTLAVVGATSAFSLNAVAQNQAAPAAAASAPEHRHGHGHMRHGPGAAMGLMPLGGRHLDRLLDEVKATDAQRTQIKAVAQAAAQDLKPLHDNARKLREQSLALFAQPQVDAVAAENLRVQTLAGHDAMSKRLLQAALEVSKILTPEQRTQLVTKLQKHHGRMGHHGQEPGRLEQ